MDVVTDYAIILLSKGCPQLTHIDLSFCVLLTDNSTISISNQCKNLANINILSCTRMTTASIIILSLCSNLITVQLPYSNVTAASSTMVIAHFIMEYSLYEPVGSPLNGLFRRRQVYR